MCIRLIPIALSLALIAPASSALAENVSVPPNTIRQNTHRITPITQQAGHRVRIVRFSVSPVRLPTKALPNALSNSILVPTLSGGVALSFRSDRENLDIGQSNIY